MLYEGIPIAWCFRSKAEKKNRGIFVKDDTLNFKMTSIGDTTEMQFKLCNDTKELQKVNLLFVLKSCVI